MSRTVIGLVAVGAVIIAVALGIAWRGEVTDQVAIGKKAAPAASAAVAPPAAAPAAAAPPAAAPPAATPPKSAPAEAQSAPPPAPTPSMPTFDVARIETDGRAVIAGRAAPGAKVVLLDGGKEIASGVADARGEWVILAQDPPLSPGSHELRIVQHIAGRAPVTSEQVVIALVPAPQTAAAPSGGTVAANPPPSAKDETLVMIAPPAGPATLLQSPSAGGVPKANDLQLLTLDYDERGQVTVTGKAEPGTSVRVYMNDTLAGESVAGADGRWRVTPSQPIEPGNHTLRLDRLKSDGKPAARLELPFARPAPKTAGGDGPRRLTIVRGDNLWNIARAHYGEGLRYTLIFDANKDQIRDPDLIYPGQIFSLPKVN
ncbi:MAG: LysM peptidoglycan-binding domain-containing protein [Enhydrobacter sp.]|nr:MAG: LysM peptidoglycan-binding domain-containing protein [Enhydrobacter sp.]